MPEGGDQTVIELERRRAETGREATVEDTSSGQADNSVGGIRIRDVSHVFVTPTGKAVQAIEHVSLDVKPGEFVSIVGPSGCGKTTVMNMVAGVVKPTAGTVHLNGVPCTAPRRDVGYMFARDALIPWRNAKKNIEFGLEIRGLGRARRSEVALGLLKRVGREGFEAAYPKERSQGMRQRLAVARTLAIDPNVILLDEPFAALDAETRVNLQNEFSHMWHRLKKTVLLVTHDLQEAIALSDRVLVMSGRPGSIKAEIEIPFARPRNIADLRFTDDFQHLAERVWRKLKDEFKA